jgi:hypothetical protein
MIPIVAALTLVLQQYPMDARQYSTPPSGDTIGYWQQRVHYRIVARLDEARGVLRGEGLLTYVNNSPDTLRELYVHQFLNAFRPGSKWSAADAREGRVRFQNLDDPDYAYERFTATPTIGNVPVRPEYPGAPDSTVVRLALPHPLAPRDSLLVTFEWEARPSTLPRRQGRRGRSFDFAQWYPRVAVYDRGGWAPNPLVPAGEFYGEFGAYDVTLVVPNDQVIGATGVPVDGDPGWERARIGGAVYGAASAYGAVPERAAPEVPGGFRRVRFYAERVHHFAWSASPDYRYEGGVYVRERGGAGAGVWFPTWDTVAVHVLYRPGDDSTWGGGVAVERTITALRWLESVYGPYGYPQMTNLHRIEGGGTEFPMMMMNGSASQSLILHEGGHVFTHGILANNEWRSGWLDEGLTSYQTAWFSRSTPQDRPRMGDPATSGRSPPGRGYAARGVRPDPSFAARLAQQRLVHTGRAEPIGTPAHEFNEFAVYNAMIYGRAEIMYGALRETLGDSAFSGFLRDYYRRWAFKHVDEVAMRTTAERAAPSMVLGWFFEQWVRRVGNVDYALGRMTSQQNSDGSWDTRVWVERRGDYLHAMPLGVRTADGWEVTRLDAQADDAYHYARTTSRPLAVRLDPYLATFDWDRRNDVAAGAFGVPGRRQMVFDWPFLDQVASDRQVAAIGPWAMPGAAGGLALGFRIRSNYQGWIDRVDAGFATSIGLPDRDAVTSRAGRWRNLWLTWDNPVLGGSRPVVGARAAGWYVDDAVRVDVAKTWDVSRFTIGTQRTRTLGLTALVTNGLAYLDPVRWEDGGLYELSVTDSSTSAASRVIDRLRVQLAGGLRTPPGVNFASTGTYVRLAAEVPWRLVLDGGAWEPGIRGFVGFSSSDTPLQRKLRLAALDPVETFGNHFLRSSGSPLAEEDARFTPRGNGGLRGYDPRVTVKEIMAVNVDLSRRLAEMRWGGTQLELRANVFADAANVTFAEGDDEEIVGDAGVGLGLRGNIFDRRLDVRFDMPIYLSSPELAIAGKGTGKGVAWRWTISTGR